MNDMKKVFYYAIDFSSGELLVSPIDKFSEAYHHVIEIQNMSDNNGNGKDQMKIYTKGKLTEICVGSWKVDPIVEMYFNWSGYCDRIRVSDLDGATDIIRITPCPLTLFKRDYSSYLIDVTGIIDYIYSLAKYKDLQHYKLIKQIEQVSNFVKKDNYTEDTTNPKDIINRLQKLVDMYESLIQTLENHSYEGTYADAIIEQLEIIQNKLSQLPSAKLDLDKVSKLLNR